MLRSEIVGGNGGIYCRLDCTVQDSWIHGTDLDPNSEWHASAVRVEQHSTLIHNTMACDYLGPFTNDEIGCSADMTGYPDFVPIMHNTIGSNLFVANSVGSGFCAYGGGTLGKPYSGDPANATYIVFRDNVFRAAGPTTIAARTVRSPTSSRDDRATCGQETAGRTAGPFLPPDRSVGRRIAGPSTRACQIVAGSSGRRRRIRCWIQSAGPGVANNIPAAR